MNSVAGKNTLNIMIGGEAGQGLVTVGELLARSLVRSGYHIVVTQSYQSRIRGGHNNFAIRVSRDPIQASQESIDLLVAMNAETLDLHKAEVASTGLIVADDKLNLPSDATCLRVPFGTLAPKTAENIVALGVAGTLLGISETTLADTVKDHFGIKKAELVEGNRQALGKTCAWVTAHTSEFPRLAPPLLSGQRLMLNGNEGIALGALCAGVKFCAFYPMTPSTSIPLTLIQHAAALGLIVEQAEDEIAAINMAIGASFAGAPSMVATSGGGFALMVEGVSLAAMTETPVVIVVGQRPGPATGLPTRTEQGDLEFVLHAGHGEFPRAIFAPGSIRECFDLTRKAFHLAHRYQGPVFLLTDQFLADSYRTVARLDLDCIPPVGSVPEPPPELPYKRFAITDTGVSPRCLPGASTSCVVADSDEHTEDGHITEDLGVRRQMVEKRLRKGRGIAREVIAPVFHGDRGAELLLVSWGSSYGAVAEAASILRERGVRTGVLHFPQVWPLVPDLFLDELTSARRVVGVEGNATGQFARLIRRETGFHIQDLILRYDGLPLTPEYIVERLTNER